jgi:hypothetical protein
MLRPGRAKLSMKPLRTRSTPMTMTIGIVEVAAFAAAVTKLLPVTFTSTGAPSSAASAGSVSTRPPAQRCTTLYEGGRLRVDQPLLAQPLLRGPYQRVVGVRRAHVEEADAREPLGAQGPRRQRGGGNGWHDVVALH